MTNKKKLVFISHEASRTGAPILLLRLIQEIKRKANFDVIILLKYDGELKKDFQLLGKTFIWNPSLSHHNRLKDRILRILKLQPYFHRKSFLKELKKVDFIFNNTITNASLLKEIPIKGKKVFSYFHELEVITEHSATKEEVKYLNSISEKIFIPSLAVKDFLIKDYNISGEKMHLLNYIIPLIDPAVKSDLNTTDIDRTLPNDKFLVGLCGALHWRKGYEFLPLIARKIVLLDKITDINFVWIGANKNLFEYILFKNDLKKLNLEDYFTFIQPIKDVNPYLSKMHLLALPSREDAFPLVVLEAAALEVPTICFSKSGGITEFIGDDAGLIVDYLDIDGIAEAIIKLKNNSIHRKLLGKTAKEKVSKYINNEFTVNELIKLFNQ